MENNLLESNLFSENSNYAIEAIPNFKGLFSYLKRKKWIDEKIASKSALKNSSFGKQKAVVFIDKNKILLSFLEDEQQYWLPAEKANFYSKVLGIESGLVIEDNDDAIKYYGIVDKFLVYYGQDFDDAMDDINLYNHGKNIEIIGIGNTKDEYIILKCNKIISLSDLENKISNFFQEQNKEIEYGQNEINDELIYLNEAYEQSFEKYDKKQKINEIFYHWFENIRNKKGKKNSKILISMLIGLLFFGVLDIYFAYDNYKLKSELNSVLTKLNNIANKNLKEDLNKDAKQNNDKNNVPNEKIAS